MNKEIFYGLDNNGNEVLLDKTDIPQHDNTIMQSDMTLRDYFAGQAQNVLLEYFNKIETFITFDDMAVMAYRSADAMMKERLK